MSPAAAGSWGLDADTKHRIQNTPLQQAEISGVNPALPLQGRILYAHVYAKEPQCAKTAGRCPRRMLFKHCFNATEVFFPIGIFFVIGFD